MIANLLTYFGAARIWHKQHIERCIMMHQIKQSQITACPDASARHVLHPQGKHLQLAIYRQILIEIWISLFSYAPFCDAHCKANHESNCTLLYMVLEQFRKICLFNEDIRMFIRQRIVANLKRLVGTAVPETLRGSCDDAADNHYICVPV